jgi:hypothetical protein
MVNLGGTPRGLRGADEVKPGLRNLLDVLSFRTRFSRPGGRVMFDIIDRVFSLDFLNSLRDLFTVAPKTLATLLIGEFFIVSRVMHKRCARRLTSKADQIKELEKQKASIEEQKRAEEARGSVLKETIEMLKTQIAVLQDKTGRDVQQAAAHAMKVDITLNTLLSNAEPATIKNLLTEVETSANAVFASSTEVRNLVLTAADLTTSPPEIGTSKFRVTSKSE